MNPLVRQIRIGTFGVASSSKQGVERFGTIVTKCLFVMKGMGWVSVYTIVKNVNVNVQHGGCENSRRTNEADAEKALYYFQKKEWFEILSGFNYQT